MLVLTFIKNSLFPFYKKPIERNEEKKIGSHALDKENNKESEIKEQVPFISLSVKIAMIKIFLILLFIFIPICFFMPDSFLSNEFIKYFMAINENSTPVEIKKCGLIAIVYLGFHNILESKGLTGKIFYSTNYYDLSIKQIKIFLLFWILIEVLFSFIFNFLTKDRFYSFINNVYIYINLILLIISFM